MDITLEERAQELAKVESLGEEMKEEKSTYQPAEVSVNKEVKLPAYNYDDNKSTDENAMELSDLVATQKAVNDKQFIAEVAETKKEAIRETAKSNKDIHLNKKEAEKINSLTEIDIAFCEKWKTILNFGRINDPVTKPLAIFLIALILPFYIFVMVTIVLPFAIVTTMLKAINSLLEEIKTFGKVAKSIAFSILIIGVLGLIVYLILFFLNKYGIVNIF